MSSAEPEAAAPLPRRQTQPGPLRAPSPASQGHNQPAHELLLLQSGEQLFAAMAVAIDAARRSVHVETYLFLFSGGALVVAEALARAAARGLQVRLVMDAIGTPPLPPLWVARFAQVGVHWCFYSPLGRLGLLIPSRWRRLHRKLCVVDGEWGFCGGINLIDDHEAPGQPRLEAPRLDYALRVRGPLVREMAQAMQSLWWRLRAVHQVRQRAFSAAWKALRVSEAAAQGPSADQGTAAVSAHCADLQHTVEHAPAQLLLRDNLLHRHRIERAYLKAIGEARSEVLIANAYFIPGRRLRRALVMAVRRGVRVRLLLQGRYEFFFQFHAARPVYSGLLQAGVEIFEYSASALHAKVAVVDRRWSTIGSSNLDPLSLLLAREANVVCSDPRFADLLAQRLELAIEQGAQPVDAAALRARPWRQRLFDWIAFGAMRAVLFLTGYRY